MTTPRDRERRRAPARAVAAACGCRRVRLPPAGASDACRPSPSPCPRGCCILGWMLTERDVILRLVRQLAELLAAVLRLRREGRREEALRQIDSITGRLTGMDAPGPVSSARRPWPDSPASSRFRWPACSGPARGCSGTPGGAPMRATPCGGLSSWSAVHARRGEARGPTAHRTGGAARPRCHPLRTWDGPVLSRSRPAPTLPSGQESRSAHVCHPVACVGPGLDVDRARLLRLVERPARWRCRRPVPRRGEVRGRQRRGRSCVPGGLPSGSGPSVQASTSGAVLPGGSSVVSVSSTSPMTRVLSECRVPTATTSSTGLTSAAAQSVLLTLAQSPPTAFSFLFAGGSGSTVGRVDRGAGHPHQRRDRGRAGQRELGRGQ